MTTDNYVDREPPRFVIKGHHVLFGLIGFFGVTIAVNVLFITLALRTFSGEDTPRSYVQGLEYNEVIEARRMQAEIGWQAAVYLEDEQVFVALESAEGEPVSGVFLEGRLRHPADTALDRPLAFHEREPGVYVAEARDLPEGVWILTAQVDGARPFEMEHRLWRR